MAKLSSKSSTRLEYDTVNALFRKAQGDHVPPLNPMFNIQSSCRPNIHGLLFDDGFDTSGLIQGLSPEKQLEILKIKERLILIDRWEEAWSQVRSPKNQWYTLSTKEFSFELARHNSLLRNKKLQLLQAQTRGYMIELYHNLSFYSQI